MQIHFPNDKYPLIWISAGALHLPSRVRWGMKTRRYDFEATTGTDFIHKHFMCLLMIMFVIFFLLSVDSFRFLENKIGRILRNLLHG